MIFISKEGKVGCFSLILCGFLLLFPPPPWKRTPRFSQESVRIAGNNLGVEVSECNMNEFKLKQVRDFRWNVGNEAWARGNCPVWTGSVSMSNCSIGYSTDNLLHWNAVPAFVWVVVFDILHWLYGSPLRIWENTELEKQMVKTLVCPTTILKVLKISPPCSQVLQPSKNHPLKI